MVVGDAGMVSILGILMMDVGKYLVVVAWVRETLRAISVLGPSGMLGTQRDKPKKSEVEEAWCRVPPEGPHER